MFACKELERIIIKMSPQNTCNESAWHLNIKGLAYPKTQSFDAEGQVAHP